jgi:dTDP-4-dehydrorhamnose reductase
MTVAVIGANGQLGSDVVAALTANGDRVVGLTHADIELSDYEAVMACLASSQAKFVVNTAAMHHVEQCERDPEKAFAVNAVGARNLALATKESGAVLVHFSTDYVFDGKKNTPYVEDDEPVPLNVYGNSKLAGEGFIRTLNPRHFVLRTSAIYGKQPCRAKGGLNFVELMLKLGRERGRVRVVNSEFVSPTPTADLARQVVALRQSTAYGLYHATAEGSCSWHEFAGHIFAAANLPVQVDVADPSEFPAKVPRPMYSVLENRRLKSEGLNRFQSWQSGLAEYLGVAQALHAS